MILFPPLPVYLISNDPVVIGRVNPPGAFRPRTDQRSLCAIIGVVPAGHVSLLTGRQMDVCRVVATPRHIVLGFRANP